MQPCFRVAVLVIERCPSARQIVTVRGTEGNSCHEPGDVLPAIGGRPAAPILGHEHNWDATEYRRKCPDDALYGDVLHPVGLPQARYHRPRVHEMTRVAIFGNTGAGKSTLARKLAAVTGLPLYPLDLIQWRVGDAPVPHEEYPAGPRQDPQGPGRSRVVS